MEYSYYVDIRIDLILGFQNINISLHAVYPIELLSYKCRSNYGLFVKLLHSVQSLN